MGVLTPGRYVYFMERNPGSIGPVVMYLFYRENTETEIRHEPFLNVGCNTPSCLHIVYKKIVKKGNHKGGATSLACICIIL